MAQDWRYSSQKAKKELGYKPRGLDETLRETVDWYVELMQSGVASAAGARRRSRSDRSACASPGGGGLRVLHALEGWTGRRLVAAG